MRAMKDSGVEWIGEIPASKKIVRNKYMLEYVKGKLPSSTNAEQRGMAYIGASDLDSNDNYQTFTEDTVIPNAEYNDLLVLWDGARAGLAGTHKVGKLSSTVVRIRFINDKMYQPFLYWYYKGFEFYMYQKVSGTTIPHMNRQYIEEIALLDWTYKEQQRIADYLDEKCGKIDAIIEREQAVIEKLNEYKQSIITEAVTKGLNPHAEMKDSGIEWIGEIPSNWEIIKANRIIISTQNGLTRRDMDLSRGNIVLKLKNITKDGILTVVELNRIELSEQEIKTYALKDGDILFVRVNGSKNLVGKCVIYQEIEDNVAYNDHIIRVRLNTHINKHYFYWYLQSDSGKKEIELYTLTAAGQFTINSSGLKSIKLPLAPKEEQKKIVNYLDNKCAKINKIIETKQSVIDKLTEYKKSLIYEVVTGKKEI